jgi:hypothetical protein
MAWPVASPSPALTINQDAYSSMNMFEQASDSNGLNTGFEFNNEQWDVSSIPFSEILDLSAWRTPPQFEENSIDVANSIWDHWPTGQVNNLFAPTATIDSSVQAAGKYNSPLQSLCELLSRSPWQPLPINDLPSMQQIEHFVNLYFVHFHTVSRYQLDPYFEDTYSFPIEPPSITSADL